jgi:hypothetical protein
MDVILHAIRGLGGTVLKTNVDVERAKLIQATLAGDGELATRAELSGPVAHPQASTWQIVVGLLRNAFWRALVPGADRQDRQP